MLTANEAACVTGVPLRQVHRIIDTGVLGSAAARREGSRLVHCDGLVSLKLVHETTAIFTLDGRRRLVRYLLDHPEAETACVDDVSVDVREMKEEVRRGLSRLARARETITARRRRALRHALREGDPHPGLRHRRDARQRRRDRRDPRCLAGADGGADRSGGPLRPGLSPAGPSPDSACLAFAQAGRLPRRGS